MATPSTPRKRRSNRDLANEATSAAKQAANEVTSATTEAKDVVKRKTSGALQQAKRTSSSKGLSPVKLYLILYNAVNALLWLSVFVLLVAHLVHGQAANTVVGRFKLIVDKLVKDVTNSTKHKAAYEHDKLVGRLSTAYDSVGDIVKAVQTLALLEIVHSALGLVRSGLLTTLMQLSSRIFVVWYVCPFYPENAQSPFYTSMVLAWSITEIIRYSHYVTSILGAKAPLLEWLRYSTFYVLYPVGALSEAALIFYSAPHAQRQFGLPGFFATVAICAVWPPSLLVMMGHMIKQRRKHLLAHQTPKVHALKEIEDIQAPILNDISATPARSTRSQTRAH
ncbi:hypothetical protein OIO90_003828 [Microbotryomycetes sp. JL221]|nr:hypothetical protein OIO90_003828 [Microbotryomycetes sp. JL221]